MDVIVFLIVLEIIGLLSFPLSRIIAGTLSDRGYSLARPIGIVIVSLTAWVCSSLGLVPFIASAGIGLLLLAALAVGAAYLHRDLKPDREMLLQEGIFILAFLLAVLFLMQKPEIYFEYSEDFMDSAILQSILRTGPIPFADPWFAGYGLTYYYFGQLAAAVPIALSLPGLSSSCPISSGQISSVSIRSPDLLPDGSPLSILRPQAGPFPTR